MSESTTDTGDATGTDTDGTTGADTGRAAEPSSFVVDGHRVTVDAVATEDECAAAVCAVLGHLRDCARAERAAREEPSHSLPVWKLCGRLGGRRHAFRDPPSRGEEWKRCGRRRRR
jgi:hypothetical protein